MQTRELAPVVEVLLEKVGDMCQERLKSRTAFQKSVGERTSHFRMACAWRMNDRLPCTAATCARSVIERATVPVESTESGCRPAAAWKWRTGRSVQLDIGRVYNLIFYFGDMNQR